MLTEPRRHHGAASGVGRAYPAPATLVKALKSLEDKNIILSEKRGSPEQGSRPTYYGLDGVGGPSLDRPTGR
jgi:hypothetical protein